MVRGSQRTTYPTSLCEWIEERGDWVRDEYYMETFNRHEFEDNRKKVMFRIIIIHIKITYLFKVNPHSQNTTKFLNKMLFEW